MQLSDFDYCLPSELIAQHPPFRRRDARLLVLDEHANTCRDDSISALLELLQPGDLLVANDTQVIAARIFGRKATGGRVEILIERLSGETTALAQIRASKAPKCDTVIGLDGDFQVRVGNRTEMGLFELNCESGTSWAEIMASSGHVPLPPYIDRSADSVDQERYQTVYARIPGAVAAPTAGLHFDKALLEAIEARGVATAFITLHVGAGTFQPVRVKEITDHKMHAEVVHVDQALCDQVAATRQRGGRVVCVGTTSVRALETAAQSGTLLPFSGDTQLFIYPGYRFRVVDAMLTNFHLPKSTLLMLICAFAGTERVLAAYRHAIAARYRFFSYGDAMWITPKVAV